MTAGKITPVDVGGIVPGFGLEHGYFPKISGFYKILAGICNIAENSTLCLGESDCSLASHLLWRLKMQPPQFPATSGQNATQKPPVQGQLPPVLLVKAETTHSATGLPLFEDKERLLKYSKWVGLAFLGLLLLSAVFGEGDPASDNSTATPASYDGSYEDRMNAGIAELGGTYDAPSGTMTTNR